MIGEKSIFSTMSDVAFVDYLKSKGFEPTDEEMGKLGASIDHAPSAGEREDFGVHQLHPQEALFYAPGAVDGWTTNSIGASALSTRIPGESSAK